MNRDVVILAYLLGVLGILRLWSIGRYRFAVAELSPGEILIRRVEEASQGAASEIPLVNGASLARRESVLVLLGLAWIGMAGGAWVLCSHLFGRGPQPEDEFYLSHVMTRGILIPGVVLGLGGLLLQQFWTYVDGRGIHRPGWRGREFIPWSAITEISIGGMSRAATLLVVRAGEKRVPLVLETFRNPADVLTLIHRHVSESRLIGL
jgi:hypothetical protein